MRAEQRVIVRTRGQQRQLRGVIAIERPDRLRLRALGPGGIRLFDVVAVDGRVHVLAALRAVRPDSLFASLLESIAGDLRAAYDLAPRPPGHERRLGRGAAVVTEPGRSLRLTHFRRAPGGKTYPGRIEITNQAHDYQVRVDAGETTLDESLDAALFSPGSTD